MCVPYCCCCCVSRITYTGVFSWGHTRQQIDVFSRLRPATVSVVAIIALFLVIIVLTIIIIINRPPSLFPPSSQAIKQKNVHFVFSTTTALQTDKTPRRKKITNKPPCKIRSNKKQNTSRPKIKSIPSTMQQIDSEFKETRKTTRQ